MSSPTGKLGVGLATGIVMGNMVGSGIFLLPAVLASVGAGSLLSWFFAAIAAATLAAAFGVLAANRPPTEGLIEYPATAIHPIAGLVNWWGYWFTCWFGNIAILLATVGYGAALFSVELNSVGQTALLLALIWATAIINMIGARTVGRISAATLAIGLIPIVAVIIVGAIKFDAAMFADAWNVSGKPLIEAAPPIVLTIFWAFLGLESANTLYGVVDNPRRTIPIAAVAGTLGAALIYALASTAMFGLLPAAALQTSSAPFADAIAVAAGPIAGALVAATAFARTFGCATSWMLVTAEAQRAGAKHRYIPTFVAKAGANRTRDIIAIAILMSLVSIATISPTLNEQFFKIVDITVIVFLGVYALGSLSLMRFAPNFKTPGARLWGAILGAGGMFVSAAVTLGYFLL